MIEKELLEKNRTRDFMTAEIEKEEEKERTVQKSVIWTDHWTWTLDEFIQTGKITELKQKQQISELDSWLLGQTHTNLLSVKKLLLLIERDEDESFAEMFREHTYVGAINETRSLL